ncbi:nuclear transport factor 2 family protein [Streptomyces sp. MUM 178J]|uniref:nuclear transport factor 2 family protein n=1 Tax=Streptomyces sp. MUM 178J TaxID=2791991 RepID=UPI001F03365B|nr:nuclear transport factor 2 family protein [Streptomyces sp. MUM 178J]WRQ80973.1 nuclear transport factor 2 family protein [Streptomyces sp. MUM 178J]
MTDHATAHTRATVQEFLARTAAASPDDIAALFADEVDWEIADNPSVPWIRPRSTRADVAAHFRELAEGQQPDPGATAVDVIVVEGSEAMLSGRLAGTVRATGKYFTSPFAMRLTVEDGLITRYRVYEDSLAIAAACTPDGPGVPVN